MTQATAVKIEPATPADIPLIRTLIGELADYEKLAHEVVATEAMLSEALFGPNPGVHALIAAVAGERAGFALYFHNFSTFLGRSGLYLEDLFVRPAYRGHGVGRALLAHLAKLAVARGCERFDWAVLDWNTSARDFYASLGAEANPQWIGYRLRGEALRRLAASAP